VFVKLCVLCYSSLYCRLSAEKTTVSWEFIRSFFFKGHSLLYLVCTTVYGKRKIIRRIDKQTHTESVKEIGGEVFSFFFLCWKNVKIYKIKRNTFVWPFTRIKIWNFWLKINIQFAILLILSTDTSANFYSLGQLNQVGPNYTLHFLENPEFVIGFGFHTEWLIRIRKFLNGVAVTYSSLLDEKLGSMRCTGVSVTQSPSVQWRRRMYCHRSVFLLRSWTLKIFFGLSVGGSTRCQFIIISSNTTRESRIHRG